MALTYDDLEELKLGKQTKIAQLARQQLENELEDESRKVGAEEAVLAEKRDTALSEDALAIIDQMDQLYERGEDPMKVFQQLPPELQERVAQLLQERAAIEEEKQMQQLGPLAQQGQGVGMQGQQAGVGQMQGQGQGYRMQGRGQQGMYGMGQDFTPLPQNKQSTGNITDIAKQIAIFQ